MNMPLPPNMEQITTEDELHEFVTQAMQTMMSVGVMSGVPPLSTNLFAVQAGITSIYYISHTIGVRAIREFLEVLEAGPADGEAQAPLVARFEATCKELHQILQAKGEAQGNG